MSTVKLTNHQGAGSNLTSIANTDIAQDRCTCSQQDAITNLGVSIIATSSTSSKSHVMEDTTIVSNGSRLADHNACLAPYKSMRNMNQQSQKQKQSTLTKFTSSMIQHDSTSKGRIGMNINLKAL